MRKILSFQLQSVPVLPDREFAQESERLRKRARSDERRFFLKMLGRPTRLCHSPGKHFVRQQITGNKSPSAEGSLRQSWEGLELSINIRTRISSFLAYGSAEFCFAF